MNKEQVFLVNSFINNDVLLYIDISVEIGLVELVEPVGLKVIVLIVCL